MTVESIESCGPWQYDFRVRIPRANFRQKYLAALEDAGRKVSMPGFRKGRIPLVALEKKFGPEVKANTARSMVDTAVSAALGARKWQLLSPIVLDYDELAELAQKSECRTESVLVEIWPMLTPPSVEEYAFDLGWPEYDEDLTEQFLQNVCVIEAEHKDVEAVAAGTIVGITHDVGDGPVETAIDSDEWDGKLEGRTVYRGISSLLGRKAGDSVTLPAVPPLDIKIAFIQEKADPLTLEELRVKLGFDSLDAMREAARMRMQGESEYAFVESRTRDCLDMAAAIVPFPLPASIVESRFQEIRRKARWTLEAAGLKPDGVFEDECRQRAERDARDFFLVYAFAGWEGVDVTQQEVMKRLSIEAAELGLPPNHEQVRARTQDVALSIREHKTVRAMIERARFHWSLRDVEGDWTRSTGNDVY